MTGKIFRGIFLVSILTIIASMIFIIGVQYQVYDEAQKGQLEAKANYIADAIEKASYSYIDGLSQTQDRITLVDTDGTVLFDNMTDIEKMENHIERDEISTAIKDGRGIAVRRSETTGSNTCYFALRLTDGKILRVADKNVSLFTIILQLLPPISAVILITVIISLVLSSVIAQRIVKPINELDLDSPVVEESYEELSPLIAKINAQNRKISKQIKKITQHSREFEIIADTMNEGLIITDEEGIILLSNSSIAKIFSLPADKKINGKNIITLNSSKEILKISDAIKEGKHRAVRLELDGSVYEILANPTADDKGKLYGGVILIVDISEKENSEKLRREFSANVSHELKTPLTSIYGISDMLKSGIVKEEDVKGFASDINSESARLITLVEDIIRLSRLDEGVIPDMNEAVNLKKSAEEALRSLENMAESRNITFNFNGEDTFILGSSTMIFELVRNLCENAIKYNKDGGSVTVTVGKENEKNFIKVKDTGIGIPKEDTERVFERFYRVDKSHSKKSGGTGLGLSIVKHIAACHNAEISLESRLGEGTQIKVLFPLV